MASTTRLEASSVTLPKMVWLPPWLLGNHTIFGKVVDEASKRVVDAIATTPTGAQDRPVTEQVINSIEIVD